MSEGKILEHLLEAGKITREDIAAAESVGADSVLNSCATLLHTFFCRKEHMYEPGQDMTLYEGKEVCLWYMEQVMENEWLQDVHREWLEFAAHEMGRQGFVYPQQLRDYLLALRQVLNEITSLSTKYGRGLLLVEEFIQQL